MRFAMVFARFRYASLRFATPRYSSPRFVMLRHVGLRFVARRNGSPHFGTIRTVLLRFVSFRNTSPRFAMPSQGFATLPHVARFHKALLRFATFALVRYASQHFVMLRCVSPRAATHHYASLRVAALCRGAPLRWASPGFVRFRFVS